MRLHRINIDTKIADNSGVAELLQHSPTGRHSADRSGFATAPAGQSSSPACSIVDFPYAGQPFQVSMADMHDDMSDLEVRGYIALLACSSSSAVELVQSTARRLMRGFRSDIMDEGYVPRHRAL